MYTFNELIKRIRKEADLTQAEFAKTLDVSEILIAMVETGQKEVSKKLLLKLAERLDVHPASITPFLFVDKKQRASLKISKFEKAFIAWGEKVQTYLIREKAKKLKRYVR